VTSALLILVIGFFLGMRHATDPDHVVAVSTIVSRERSIPRAGWVGILWGVGHTLTILVVGAAIILFGIVIPPRLGLTLEFSVALMLIMLGVLNLTGAMHWLSHRFSPTHPEHHGSHTHLHSHGEYAHIHPHSHSPLTATSASPEHHAKEVEPPHWLRAPFARLGIFHSLRPLLIGIVHGLAGSAAVALLVLATIREPRLALLYLLVFGIGTVAGMIVITAAIGFPFVYAGRTSERFSSALRVSSGLLSLGFGLFLAYRIGFLNGLFNGRPNWTPH